MELDHFLNWEVRIYLEGECFSFIMNKFKITCFLMSIGIFEE